MGVKSIKNIQSILKFSKYIVILFFLVGILDKPCTILNKRVLLMSVLTLRTLINNLFLKSFNIAFMRNEKSCQNISLSKITLFLVFQLSFSFLTTKPNGRKKFNIISLHIHSKVFRTLIVNIKQ